MVVRDTKLIKIPLKFVEKSYSFVIFNLYFSVVFWLSVARIVALERGWVELQNK